MAISDKIITVASQKSIISKLIPILSISCIIVFFIFSFLRGTFLVQKSEKELNSKVQINEAQAEKYSLKEIDAKTGQIRWQLTAKEGMTEDNLEAALIKNIKAEMYKDKKVIFELTAPQAKANASTKEIYLLGDVTAKDKDGKFLLTANQIALGMGTSIEAQKGFNLNLKNNGTLNGDSALINDDQTKIIIKKLEQASFKDIALSGEEVSIERDEKGEPNKATLSNGGKIILKNSNNDTLSANTIKWTKDGQVFAIGNVVYIREDKTFKAGELLLKPDKKLYAKNTVSITHGQTQCSGSSLSFENSSLIIISGNPKAIQGDKTITADKIVYNLDTSKVEATGNVKTTVTNKLAKI